jgi:hypothetical protein
MQKIVDGVIFVMTPEEISARLTDQAEFEARRADREAESLRTRRDGLLQKTDWIAIRAYEGGEPVPPAWANYRQALRNITAQAGFPYAVQWPTQPE